MELYIGILWIIYFIFIPCVYVLEWQERDNKQQSFFKWYIIKSDSVNYLGFAIFLILGLGSFLPILFWYILKVIFNITVVSLSWLFEFLFLNKDCSNIVCQELVDKELERENLKHTKIEAQDLDDFMDKPSYEAYLKALNNSFFK